jgi:hypothetical protein
MVTEPTTEKLARALEEEHAPQYMIDRARAGYYDDYKSPIAFPEMELLGDAELHDLKRIKEGVYKGEWDGTKEESDEWARSPEGQEVFNELIKPNRQQRRHPK